MGFVLPIVCKRCSASFDLRHDLLERGIETKEEINEFLNGFEERFCWDCRNVIAGESEATGEQQEVEEIEELELNFSLGF